MDVEDTVSADYYRVYLPMHQYLKKDRVGDAESLEAYRELDRGAKFV